MDNIPPGALKVFNSLPESVQEKVQEFAFKALQNPNIVPLATIPIAWQLAYLPHFLKAGILVMYKTTDYNNETPRETNVGEVGKLGGVMTRAKAAHYNALEMFPAFALAVLTARVQKVNPMKLAQLCGRYLALRVLYTFLYIFGINKVIAAGRTLSWVAMTDTIMKIYGEALL